MKRYSRYDTRCLLLLLLRGFEGKRAVTCVSACTPLYVCGSAQGSPALMRRAPTRVPIVHAFPACCVCHACAGGGRSLWIG